MRNLHQLSASTPDFSTMNFSTPNFSTMIFWTMGLKSSWLKSLGLKCHLSRRLKDISTPHFIDKAEDCLKVHLFCTIRKNQSRFEWRPIRRQQYFEITFYKTTSFFTCTFIWSSTFVSYTSNFWRFIDENWTSWKKAVDEES